eukprot:1853478-Karenia_brevis.AAC.1
MSTGSPGAQSRLDARELDHLHEIMFKTVSQLNDSIGDAMKDFSSNVDRLEDGAMERIKDLEEEMSQTVRKM